MHKMLGFLRRTLILGAFFIAPVVAYSAPDSEYPFQATFNCTSGATAFTFNLRGRWAVQWLDADNQIIYNGDTPYFEDYNYYNGRPVVVNCPATGTLTARVKVTEVDGYFAGYNVQPTIKFNNGVTRVDGSLGAIFPQMGTNESEIPFFGSTFENCTTLTSVDENLFSGLTGGRDSMFISTFRGCTGLTTVPDDLFADITVSAPYMFQGVFHSSGLTAVPDEFFAGITMGAPQMFFAAFQECPNLVSVGNGVWENWNDTADASQMFYAVFYGDSNLASLGTNLFSGVSTGAPYMFANAFYGCSSLSVLPPEMFATVTTGAPYMFSHAFERTGFTVVPQDIFNSATGISAAENMFEYMFYNVSTLTTIPYNFFNVVTGTAPNVFYATFANDNNLTHVSLPDGTVATGFVPLSIMKTNVSLYNATFGAGGFGTPDMDCPAGTNPDEILTQATQGLVCDPIEYSIAYALGGGTNSPDNPYAYTILNTPLTFADPTHDNETFGGWYSEPEFINQITGIGAGETGNMTLYAKWGSNATIDDGYPFRLETSSMGVGDTFSFQISAMGDFVIDWDDPDDPNSVQTISRNNTTQTTYSHTYSSAARTRTIRIKGLATGYNTGEVAAISFDSNLNVVGILGSLGQIFPTINNGDTPGEQPRFYNTFHLCTNLASSIPPELFSGVHGAPVSMMFRGLFDMSENPPRNVLSGTIPSGLFSGIVGAPAENMFRAVFYNCAGLTGTIPEELFAGISGAPVVGMFKGTFSKCKNLSGPIPKNLFAGIAGAPQSEMFENTFNGCTGLTGFITKALFVGITDIGTKTMTGFGNTFKDCRAMTKVCPEDLTSLVKPSNNWGTPAFCSDACMPGEYQVGAQCYTCPDGYIGPDFVGTSISDCKIWCDGGSYLASAGDTQCINVGPGYYSQGEYVAYGDVGSRQRCPDDLTTIGYGFGADDLDDCGKVLNLGGEDKVYLRAVQKTHPALAVRLGNRMFYGDMGTRLLGKVHTWYHDKLYAIYDDSIRKDSTQLPDGYTRLEYIQSVDRAYIDTGYAPSLDVDVYYLAYIPEPTKSEPKKAVYWVQQGEGKQYFSSIFIPESNLMRAYRKNIGGTDITTEIDPPDSRLIEWQTNGSVFMINGDKYRFEPPEDGYFGDYHIWVLGPNNAGVIDSGLPTVVDGIRLYRWKMKENGIIVQDLVPAMRDEDGEIGMFDRITGAFFTNAHTSGYFTGE